MPYFCGSFVVKHVFMGITSFELVVYIPLTLMVIISLPHTAKLFVRLQGDVLIDYVGANNFFIQGVACIERISITS